MSRLIILTKEGLNKFKAELNDVEANKLPQAEKEFKDVCEVCFKEDPSYQDAQEKRDFYRGRIKFLIKVIEGVNWNSEKGYYESEG